MENNRKIEIIYHKLPQDWKYTVEVNEFTVVPERLATAHVLPEKLNETLEDFKKMYNCKTVCEMRY